MITKPNPYVPSFLRAAASGSRPLTLTWSDVADTNIASTSSFQYDPHASPLKSTQQLNVDWSQFTNHTFFMSAEAKVNLAFDAIINGFPFDGTRQEVEAFFERLSGFERWVFDSFPRFRGQLRFSGTQASETSPTAGTYVQVLNKAGALFPELAGAGTGRPVLNPTGSQSLTVEMQLWVPPIVNGVQTVCQMLSGTTQGFALHLLSTSSTSSCTAQFSVVSGSSWMAVPLSITKGRFNHVAVTLNRGLGLPFLEAFLSAQPSTESPTQVELGDMDVDGSSLLIGSGTSMQLGPNTVVPTQTLSGTIDEFRVFHSARTARQLATYAAKSLPSTPDLALYYRFNEPPPPLVAAASDPINGVVLDSSGNALHALISNFSASLRSDASLDPSNPVIYERTDSTPVLFPAYPPTVALNQALLASASAYDQANPNLITRLVPQHYLLEGAQQDGFVELEGTAGSPYGGSGVPGQGRMGNVQVLVSLLYIWARFFDDIKLFVDSFSTLRTVDYDSNDTVPDNFLIDMVRGYGFNLPPLFNDSTIEQYVRGENVDAQDITVNEQSLRAVQTQLLRRVLVNLPDVLRSKGTQHSIRSFLRAVGIDPGSSVRIREFGGPTTQQLSFSRERKIEPGTMVQFSTSSLVVSPFLSASRIEPGYPPVIGQFVQRTPAAPNGVSNNRSDGLLTSGSWTWEGIVRYTPAAVAMLQSTTQSLVRLCATGSVSGSSQGSAGIIANLLAVSSSAQPKLVLYARPGDAAGAPMLRMELALPAPGVFDFDRWNVSFGCRRGDDGLASVSSSYFLRAGRQNDGGVEVLLTTASFFQEAPSGGNNVLQVTNSASNASGSYVALGTRQLILSGAGGTAFPHLNNILVAPDEARITVFDGRMSNVRFWSTALEEDEWEEHVRNYASTGVRDPLTHWNYTSATSGSFGRLRLSSLARQDPRRANSTASLGPLGSITFLDFSESGLHLTGSGFPLEQDAVVGEIFDLSYISPYFDEASVDEKVRARSFQDVDLVDRTPWAAPAPVHEIDPSERPTDDVRFVVEFSLVDVLNRDIITMFSTLDAMDDALGAPELLFAPDYPDLERMRDVYFRRIKEKLNFQAFFEFYRWFDSSIGTFIQQLVPRKTRFKGTNFTVEPHLLERAKHEYMSSEIYVGDSNRQRLDSSILLQQIAGSLRKF